VRLTNLFDNFRSRRFQLRGTGTEPISLGLKPRIFAGWNVRAEARTYLRDTNLKDTNLKDTNLKDTNLKDTNLRGTNKGKNMRVRFGLGVGVGRAGRGFQRILNRF